MVPARKARTDSRETVRPLRAILPNEAELAIGASYRTGRFGGGSFLPAPGTLGLRK